MSERLAIPTEVKAAGIDVRPLLSFQSMFQGERSLGISDEIQQLSEFDGVEVLETLFPNLPVELRPVVIEALQKIPQAILPMLYAEYTKRAATESWHAFGKAQLIGASEALDYLGWVMIRSYDQMSEQSDRSLSTLDEVRRYMLGKMKEYYEAEVARLLKEKEELEVEIQKANAIETRGQMMDEVKTDSTTGFEEKLKIVTAELREAQNQLFKLSSSQNGLQDAQEVIVYAAQDVVPTRLDQNKAVPIEP